MKRFIALLIGLICVFGLGGCNQEERLTLEKVKELAAEKGDTLSWNDFEQYNGEEIGSGLYI